jgi:hypothetical protein
MTVKSPERVSLRDEFHWQYPWLSGERSAGLKFLQGDWASIRATLQVFFCVIGAKHAGAKRMKFRLSKKFLFILGGVLVIGAGSGGAAVFVGRDRLLGTEPKDESNGLACTTLNTITSRQNGQVWVRRYITADDSDDGMVRVKTALRVARVLQQEKKADLVQVAMVDPHGPKDRADIRGRSIGAQVIYIPDPAKMPKAVQAASYAAYYYQGAAASDGSYYGMRIDLPLEDAEKLSASLHGGVDCVDPAAEAAKAAEAAADAAAADARKRDEAKEIRKREMRAKMEGEAAGPKAAEESSEAKPAEVKDDASTAASKAEGAKQDSAKQDGGGLISSISGMIFGHKSEEAKPEVAAVTADPAKGPAEAPAGHAGLPAGDAVVNAKPSGVKQAGSPQDAASPAVADAPAEKQADEGLFASIKGMIFGSADKDDAPAATAAGVTEKPGDGAQKAAAAVTDKAENGMHKASAASANAATPAVAKPSQDKAAVENVSADKNSADKNNAADAAGAAWLAKFRQQQAPAAP